MKSLFYGTKKGFSACKTGCFASQEALFYEPTLTILPSKIDFVTMQNSQNGNAILSILHYGMLFRIPDRRFSCRSGRCKKVSVCRLYSIFLCGLVGKSLEGCTKRSGRNRGQSPRNVDAKQLPGRQYLVLNKHTERYCLPDSRPVIFDPGLRPGLRPLRLVQPSRLILTYFVNFIQSISRKAPSFETEGREL